MNDFHKYYFDKKNFMQKNKKDRIWIWSIILIQLMIIVAGMVFVPEHRLLLWGAISAIGTTIMMSVLTVLCFKQLRYSSYKIWLKNYEKVK